MLDGEWVLVKELKGVKEKLTTGKKFCFLKNINLTHLLKLFAKGLLLLNISLKETFSES
ncbi:hypothetical protein ACQCVN_05415 [Rossellomorea aquimaris]